MGNDGARTNSGQDTSEAGQDTTDVKLMLKAARRFYLEDASKVEIAAELGLSRFKVARLLERARTTGIVTITLREPLDVDNDLSERLAEHLGVRETVVVSPAGWDRPPRRQVAAAAARLLSDTIHEGDVLGMTWGRTLTDMTEELTALPPVTVVQLTGVVGSNLAESPAEVVRRIASSSGGQAYAIFAPMVVESAATADSLRRVMHVKEAIQRFDEVTVAVVAVGSWDPPQSQLREVMSAEDRAPLERDGVRAEIAGILLNDDGEIVSPGFAERCIAIDAAQLGKVPRVLAVAAGRDKALALRAAAASKLVTGAVVDTELATAVLSTSPVRPPS